MRFLLLLFTLFYSLNADFISKYEYGKMLYENPRGISCKKCHGDTAKERCIAIIKKGDKNIDVTAPAIRNISKESLKKGLKKGRHFMPLYKMTDSEIDALYIFLNIN